MITHGYELPPCMVGHLIKEVHTIHNTFIPTAVVFVQGIHPKAEFYERQPVYFGYIWNEDHYMGITLFEDEFVIDN